MQELKFEQVEVVSGGYNQGPFIVNDFTFDNNQNDDKEPALEWGDGSFNCCYGVNLIKGNAWTILREIGDVIADGHEKYMDILLEEKRDAEAEQ